MEVDMGAVHQMFLAIEDKGKGIDAKGILAPEDFYKVVLYLKDNRPTDINRADEIAYNGIIDTTLSRFHFTKNQIEAIYNIYNVQRSKAFNKQH